MGVRRDEPTVIRVRELKYVESHMVYSFSLVSEELKEILGYYGLTSNGFFTTSNWKKYTLS